MRSACLGSTDCFHRWTSDDDCAGCASRSRGPSLALFSAIEPYGEGVRHEEEGEKGLSQGKGMVGQAEWEKA